MPDIVLRKVVKVYPFVNTRWALLDRRARQRRAQQQRSAHTTNEGVLAVRGVDLTIPQGEFCVLLGPSGCGKSTLLRMIAGLEDITAGEMYFGERLMNYVPAQERELAMIFQNYSLYPHLTVGENIAFPLKNQRLPREEIDAQVRAMAGLLGLTHLLGKKPRELSGGERQRVAIGRALVRRPAVFLMDEPFSNLDAALRAQMRAVMVQLHRALKSTFVYVTHDQLEAMTLADRLVVLQDGAVQQTGTPREIFQHPVNRFVAGFVGAPGMNFWDGATLRRHGENYAAEFGGTAWPLTERQNRRLRERGAETGPVTVGVRPVQLALAEAGLAAAMAFAEPLGPEANVHFTSGDGECTAVFPAEVLTNGALFKGQTVHLAPLPGKLHLFDPETGESLLAGSAN